MHTNLVAYLLIIFLFTSCNPGPSIDQNLTSETGSATEESRTNGYSEERNAYFGDLHIHTSWSFDAFIYNVRTNPDDAYRFGKGEAINHAISGEIQNNRPLDFMAVADHSEYMGIMMEMINDNSPLASLDIAKRIRSEDRNTSIAAFGEIGESISRNEPNQDLIKKEIISATWQKQVEIANRHNEPGKFTTFPAYEWTSSPGIVTDPENTYAANLHRNVIYRGDKVSEIPYSSFDSQDPEGLWKWMEGQKAMGISLLAIPHNGNMSDGMMYSKETFSGNLLINLMHF